MPTFNRSFRRGFTLGEMVIGLVIIGILSLTAFLAYQALQRRAEVGSLTTTAMQVDHEAVALAAEADVILNGDVAASQYLHASLNLSDSSAQPDVGPWAIGPVTVTQGTHAYAFSHGQEVGSVCVVYTPSATGVGQKTPSDAYVAGELKVNGTDVNCVAGAQIVAIGPDPNQNPGPGGDGNNPPPPPAEAPAPSNVLAVDRLLTWDVVDGYTYEMRMGQSGAWQSGAVPLYSLSNDSCVQGDVQLRVQGSTQAATVSRKYTNWCQDNSLELQAPTNVQVSENGGEVTVSWDAYGGLGYWIAVVDQSGTVVSRSHDYNNCAEMPDYLPCTPSVWTTPLEDPSLLRPLGTPLETHSFTTQTLLPGDYTVKVRPVLSMGGSNIAETAITVANHSNPVAPANPAGFIGLLATVNGTFVDGYTVGASFNTSNNVAYEVCLDGLSCTQFYGDGNPWSGDFPQVGAGVHSVSVFANPDFSSNNSAPELGTTTTASVLVPASQPPVGGINLTGTVSGDWVDGFTTAINFKTVIGSDYEVCFGAPDNCRYFTADATSYQAMFALDQWMNNFETLPGTNTFTVYSSNRETGARGDMLATSSVSVPLPAPATGLMASVQDDGTHVSFNGTSGVTYAVCINIPQIEFPGPDCQYTSIGSVVAPVASTVSVAALNSEKIWMQMAADGTVSELPIGESVTVTTGGVVIPSGLQAYLNDGIVGGYWTTTSVTGSMTYDSITVSVDGGPFEPTQLGSFDMGNLQTQFNADYVGTFDVRTDYSVVFRFARGGAHVDSAPIVVNQGTDRWMEVSDGSWGSIGIVFNNGGDMINGRYSVDGGPFILMSDNPSFTLGMGYNYFYSLPLGIDPGVHTVRVRFTDSRLGGSYTQTYPVTVTGISYDPGYNLQPGVEEATLGASGYFDLPGVSVKYSMDGEPWQNAQVETVFSDGFGGGQFLIHMPATAGTHSVRVKYTAGSSSEIFSYGDVDVYSP